jgi:hypothetical protein
LRHHRTVAGMMTILSALVSIPRFRVHVNRVNCAVGSQANSGAQCPRKRPRLCAKAIRREGRALSPGPDIEGPSPEGSTRILNQSFRLEEDAMSGSTTLIAPATAARKTPVQPLFEPVRLERYDLPHRMVMAPLTRSRDPPTRKRAICSQCLLLCATGLGVSSAEQQVSRSLENGRSILFGGAGERFTYISSLLVVRYPLLATAA